MINNISCNLLGVADTQPRAELDKTVAVQAGGLVDSTLAATAPKKQTDKPMIAVDDEGLNKIVGELNGFAQTVQRQLQFSIDEENGEVIVKVVDAETKDVVREIPSEEIRDMQKRLGEISEKIFKETGGTSLLFQGKA